MTPLILLAIYIYWVYWSMKQLKRYLNKWELETDQRAEKIDNWIALMSTVQKQIKGQIK